MEIMEECLRLRLLPPTDPDLQEMLSSLGTFPSSWEGAYNRDNQYFCRWLRSRGVLPFWRQDLNVQDAVRFIYRASVRKDFETLVLSVTSVEAARESLLLKYKEHLVPDVDVLLTFCDYFWNLSSMSSPDLFEFLGEHHNRTANIAAMEGNTSLAYSQTGMVEEVGAKEFYNNLIALANTQVSRARRSADMLNGSSLMGIAAISRQALEAIKERDMIAEDHRIEALDVIKEQAAAFKMRTVMVSDIPTLSELTEEENTDVRTLTIATD